METLECVLRSSPDWGLLSCFICAESGHKESPVTLAAATGSQPENVASDEQREREMTILGAATSEDPSDLLSRH